MEANQFEQHIAQRFKNHGSRTPEAVWDGVSAHLNGKKRRIGFFWWTSVLALAVLGSTAPLYFGMRTSNFGELSPRPQKTATLQVTSSQVTSSETTQQKSETEVADEAQSANTQSAQSGNSPSNSKSTVSSNSTVRSTTRTNIQASRSAATQHSTTAQSTAQSASEPTNQRVIHNAQAQPSLKSKLPDSITMPSRMSFLSPHPLHIQKGTRLPLVLNTKDLRAWHHSIGIQFSSFVNLSKPRENFTPTSNFATEATSANENDFFRFIEIAPFYQFHFGDQHSRLRLSVLMAGSKSTVNTPQSSWSAKRNYLGTGLTYFYQIRRKRLCFSAYAGANWEYSTALFYGIPQDMNTDNSLTAPPPAPQNEEATPPTIFHQQFASVETGLEVAYFLRRNLRLTGHLGYRNYIWQQELDIAPVVKVPQLLNVGIGMDWSF